MKILSHSAISNDSVVKSGCSLDTIKGVGILVNTQLSPLISSAVFLVLQIFLWRT